MSSNLAMKSALNEGNYSAVESLLKYVDPNGSYTLKLPFLGKAALLGNEKICQLFINSKADLETSLRSIYYATDKEEEKIRAFTILLDFAQGIDLEPLHMGRGLYFLDNIDISHLNFVGVSLSGRPVQRENLHTFKGFEKALVTLSDIDKLEEPRRSKLQSRLQVAYKLHGFIISQDIVNLVPFDAAVSRGDIDVISLKLYQGVKPTQRSIVIAAEKGYAEMVRLLALQPGIEKKAIASATRAASQRNLTSVLPFLRAIRGRNEKDMRGNTPLHNAILDNDITEVELLKKEGADLTLPNEEGLIPIEFAMKYNRQEIVTILT